MELRESLLRIIKVLIAAVFLTPLILGPFGLNLSEYPKAIFFRLLIEIIFVFYVWLVLKDKNFLPKKSLLLFSVVVFDVILIIASIFGVNFYLSFFGEMQRGEGLILHLHLLVFLIMMLGIFKEKEDWLWLFKVTVIISGISSVAALLQQVGTFRFYDVEPVRLSGTLSNPDLFGSYISLSILLAVFLFLSEKSKNMKMVWAGLAALNLYTLVFSQTRAAWVGLLCGTITIFILNYRTLNYKKRIISLAVVLVICLVAFAAPFLIRAVHMENSALGGRVLSIYNISINDRLNFWGIAFNAFKDRPWLGWGFESFSFVSDKYLKSGYENGIYYDRPHNKVMEILIYSGAVGMIGYLLIFALLFYLILKYSKRWNGYNGRSGILFGSIIFAFFVTGFVQSIFGFDHIGTYILFFLVLGFVNNTFLGTEDKGEQFANNPLSVGKIAVLVIAILCMAVVAYKINIEPTIAAMYFPQNVQYESSDPATALDGYRNAVTMNTVYNNDMVFSYVDRSIYLLENTFGQSAGSHIVQGLVSMRPLLEQDLKTNNERPSNVYEYLIRGDEWAYIVNRDPKDLATMNSDLNAAIAFNPNVPNFFELKGEMEILQNNNTAGENDIATSCKLNFNCTPGGSQLYQMIGVAYFKAANYKLSVESFQKALDINYAAVKSGLPSTIQNPISFIDSVANMYYSLFKDFKDAANVYQRALEIYPQYKDYFNQRLNTLATGS